MFPVSLYSTPKKTHAHGIAFVCVHVIFVEVISILISFFPLILHSFLLFLDHIKPDYIYEMH